MLRYLLVGFAVFLSAVSVQSQPAVSNATLTNVSCYGGHNGSILYQITGGPAPIHFVWSNGDTGTAGCTYAVQINNPGVGLSQFQVQVNVSLAAGMNANFSNVTFFDSLGNPLSFWLKDFPTDSSAVFWVRVDTIPPGQSTIYLSFCSSDTVSQSNPYTTFEFFENFDSGSISAWTPNCIDIDEPGEVCYSSLSSAVFYSPGYSLYFNSYSSCFGPPFDGAGSNLTLNIPLINDSLVVDYDDKAAVTLWGFCTGNTTTTNSVQADGVSLGNGRVVGQGGTCATNVSPWADETSGPFAVTTGTVALTLQTYGGDCDTSQGWFDNVRIRKYVSNPPVATVNSNVQYALDSLAAGTYTITMTDSSGRVVTDTFIITQPAQLVLTPDTTPACFGQSNGTAWVQVTGGTMPYNYIWNNGQTTDTAHALTAGAYAVIVTDNNNCTVADTMVVTQTTAIVLSADSTIACFGQSNGTAWMGVTGGTPTYTYVWSTGATTDTITGLAPGIYYLTATDASGCINADSVMVNQSPQLTLSTGSTNMLCFGANNGSAWLNVTGGTVPYTYLWSNAQTTDTINGLTNGTYYATVIDANQCRYYDSATITSPPAIQVTTTAGPILCYGQQTGTINATASGGTPGYSFTIVFDTITLTSSTGSFSGLAAGTYSLATFDQNGCEDTASVTVNQPPQLQLDVSETSNPCSASSGSITATATGGSSPYGYSFSNGANNSSGFIQGLDSGSYAVTVTDVNGCTAFATAQIPGSDSVELSITPTSGEVTLGKTLQIDATTNQSGYVYYKWEPNVGLSCNDCPDPLFDGIASNSYTLTTTDLSGCIARQTITVTVNPDYTIYFPNVFSPNGDGVNDYWQVYGNLDAVKYFTIEIFDRIGEKVFESNNVNFQWDGRYKGDYAPEGVFVYVASISWLNNYTENARVGSITVLR